MDAAWKLNTNAYRCEYEIGRRFALRVTCFGISQDVAEELWNAASAALEGVSVVPHVVYDGYLEKASRRIPRDLDDAPNVALALALGSDTGACRGIWTEDGDYLGCGVATWTTKTLLAHRHPAGNR